MAHSISHKILNNVAIISLSGYVDLEASAEISAAFNTLSRDYQKFVFDFSEVSLVNSGGISGFLDIFSKKISNSSLAFAVCNLGHSTQYSFKVVGIFNLAKESHDIASAVKELAG